MIHDPHTHMVLSDMEIIRQPHTQNRTDTPEIQSKALKLPREACMILILPGERIGEGYVPGLRVDQGPPLNFIFLLFINLRFKY
jgi:hypothetical protein